MTQPQSDFQSSFHEGRCHIVLRVPRYAIVNGQKHDVIEAHNEVLRSKKVVALGKFGKPFSRAGRKVVQRQLDEGVQTFLYLVFKSKGQFLACRAPIQSLHPDRPDSDLRAPFPDYYVKKPSYWFVLSGELVKADLGQLVLTSNSRPLLDVVAETRTPLMIVQFRSRSAAH